jgi:hypothetical protein
MDARAPARGSGSDRKERGCGGGGATAGPGPCPTHAHARTDAQNRRAGYSHYSSECSRPTQADRLTRAPTRGTRGPRSDPHPWPGPPPAWARRPSPLARPGPLQPGQHPHRARLRAPARVRGGPGLGPGCASVRPVAQRAGEACRGARGAKRHGLRPRQAAP